MMLVFETQDEQKRNSMTKHQHLEIPTKQKRSWRTRNCCVDIHYTPGTMEISAKRGARAPEASG